MPVTYSLQTEFTKKGNRMKQTCILCCTKCIVNKSEEVNEKKEKSTQEVAELQQSIVLFVLYHYVNIATNHIIKMQI